MKFIQIGNLTETQKKAIKASAMFGRFLSESKEKGAEQIKVMIEQQKTFVKVYAEARDQNEFYFVEVGPRGGLTEEVRY